jgi:hypothetical protein
MIKPWHSNLVKIILKPGRVLHPRLVSAAFKILLYKNTANHLQMQVHFWYYFTKYCTFFATLCDANPELDAGLLLQPLLANQM